MNNKLKISHIRKKIHSINWFTKIVCLSKSTSIQKLKKISLIWPWDREKFLTATLTTSSRHSICLLLCYLHVNVGTY